MKKTYVYKEIAKGEDWYPNHWVNNTPIVRIGLLSLTNGLSRVCVWGADDFGMEYDFANYALAKACFIDLIFCKEIKQSDLKKRGFIPA